MGWHSVGVLDLFLPLGAAAFSRACCTCISVPVLCVLICWPWHSEWSIDSAGCFEFFMLPDLMKQLFSFDLQSKTSEYPSDKLPSISDSDVKSLEAGYEQFSSVPE